MKCISKVLSIILIFFTLCSCEKVGNSTTIFKDEDKNFSDNLIANIVEIIEKKDSNKLTELFSSDAKKDAVNLEDEIDCFFFFFSDSNIKIEENAGPIVYDGNENGQKSKKIINWYEVYAEKNSYTIFFVAWVENTFDKEKVGLYTLRVIEEKDFDEQFIEHDKMEIAGIYYNPTVN